MEQELIYSVFERAKTGTKISVPVRATKTFEFKNRIKEITKDLRQRNIYMFASRKFNNNTVEYTFREPTAKEKESTTFDGKKV